MKRLKGFTIIELLVVIAIIAILAGMLLPALGKARDEARKVRCSNNLNQIAKSMQLYMSKYGDNAMYAIPAAAFRGDCWLVTLYWVDLLREPKVFLCPSTDDGGGVPATKKLAGDLTSAGAIVANHISYSGLCRGLSSTYAFRNTKTFTEATISSSCAMSSDNNEGAMNHGDGMNVVFFDSHVEFKPGLKAETYELIGKDLNIYSYLDSGE